jgi:hypothetical protein
MIPHACTYVFAFWAALVGALMAEMPVAPRPATNTFTSYVPCNIEQHGTARHGTAGMTHTALQHLSAVDDMARVQLKPAFCLECVS